MKKNYSKQDMFMMLFFSIFAIVGCSMCMVFIEGLDIYIKIFLGFFVFVGVLLFSNFIVALVYYLKRKHLKNSPDSYITKATFIRAELDHVGNYIYKDIYNKRKSMSVTEFYAIYYDYVDENQTLRSVVSDDLYLLNQVDFLKAKKFFAVKCKGKENVIVENIPAPDYDSKEIKLEDSDGF